MTHPLRFILFLLTVYTSTVGALAQTDDTMPGVFTPSIKSLKVEVEGSPLAPPIITLGTADRFIISFDELSDDRSYLRYSLTHCDADWRPSRVVDSEYLDGFNQANVEDYRFSEATSVHYVHYTIAIPNAEMNPLISGNYLLKVWNEDDPDKILLQARLMFAEMGASVAIEATSVTDIDYNESHQQLSLNIATDRANVADPFNDLIVKVNQNGRLDNEVTLSHPSRVMSGSAIYEHLKPLIFPAGNEYRRFETISVSVPTMGVEYLDFIDPYYNFFLTPDTPRASQNYSYDQTQHGRFFVREYNSADSEVEADYAVTHFALEMDELDDYDIFIDGDMVNRRLNPESRMVYNRATGRYERALLLKQGNYNYQYLAVPRGASTLGSTAVVEGDKYETGNEYVVRVYNRPPGARYDRLIGVGYLNLTH